MDGIVQRMKTEMGTDPKVIATGGLAELLFDVSGTIEAVEPALTLEGLRIIADNMPSPTSVSSYFFITHGHHPDQHQPDFQQEPPWSGSTPARPHPGRT